MALNITNRSSVSHDRVVGRSLLEYANENRNEGFFNDVTLKIGADFFPANRMVLSCFSDVFERMFKVEMKERYEETVEVKQVDSNSIKILLEYIYTGHIEIDNENAMELLAAADYLQLKDVKEYCFEFLLKIVSPDTWFAILTAADLYRNESLKQPIYDYLSKNLAQVVPFSDFKTLTKAELMALISNLDRNVVEESQVYQALISWTKFDEDNRGGDFSDLFNLVKLHKLSRDFFEEIVAKEELVRSDVLCLNAVMCAFSSTLKYSCESFAESIIVSFGGKSTSRKCFSVYKFRHDEMSIVSFPNLPIPLEFHQVLKLDKFAFCMGGLSHNVSSKQVWKLELETHNPKWCEVTSLNIPRYGFGAAIFDCALIVAGGRPSFGLGPPTSAVEMYKTTWGNWKYVNSLNVSRYGNALACCNGFLYALGGTNKFSDDLSSVERLSDIEAAWEIVESMPYPRRWHAAVSCCGYIYVIGGIYANTRLDSVIKYDPNQDEWSVASSMNSVRSGPAACVQQGKIFVTGGLAEDGFTVKTIECYDPQNDIWSVVGKTKHELERHSILAV